MADHGGVDAHRAWLAVTGDVVVRHPLAHVDADLSGLLGAADIAFANLEIPLTTGGAPAEKALTHRADPTLHTELTRLGVDVVTLANNHILDFGDVGLYDTLATLDAAGIDHVGAGAGADAARTAVVRNTSAGTVALIGLCSTLPPGFAATAERAGVAPIRVLQQSAVDPALAAEQPGMAPYVHTQAHAEDLQAACAAVADAARRADFVVVAVHWGVPHGFAAQSYGSLAQYQQPVGHALVDAGAALVIGHHPHEIHPVETYHGGLIAYSIGNYVFHGWSDLAPRDDQTSSAFPFQVPSAPYVSPFAAQETSESVAVIVSGTTERPCVDFVPTVMDDGEPKPAGGDRAARILDRLSGPLPRDDDSRKPHISHRDGPFPGTTLGRLQL